MPLDGLQDKKKSINDFYAKFDDKFSGRTDLEKKFRLTIDAAIEEAAGEILADSESPDSTFLPVYLLSCTTGCFVYRDKSAQPQSKSLQIPIEGTCAQRCSSSHCTCGPREEKTRFRKPTRALSLRACNKRITFNLVRPASTLFTSRHSEPATPMPKTMPALHIDFAKQVDNCISLPATGEMLRTSSQSAASALTPGRMEALYEMAYLRIFLAWEQFLEASLLRLLCGYVCASGQLTLNQNTFRSRAGGNSALLGGQRYFSWSVLEK